MRCTFQSHPPNPPHDDTSSFLVGFQPHSTPLPPSYPPFSHSAACVCDGIAPNRPLWVTLYRPGALLSGPCCLASSSLSTFTPHLSDIGSTLSFSTPSLQPFCVASCLAFAYLTLPVCRCRWLPPVPCRWPPAPDCWPCLVAWSWPLLARPVSFCAGPGFRLFLPSLS